MHNPNNLASAIYRHSLENPDSLALSCKANSLSYGQLAERAGRLAACLKCSPHFRRDHGQVPRVGILASRSVDACVALLGASWAGATYVPIGLKQPEERIMALLAQCELSAIVTDDEGAKLLSSKLLKACPPLIVHAGQTPLDLAGERGVIVNLAALPVVAPEAPAAMDASDTAYIIFTSGTTGVPKGVMITVGSARQYVTMIARQLGLLASDRALETCELSFDFSVHNMFSTWEAGAALFILPATAVMNAVKFARESSLTVWNSVPSLAGMLRQVKALKPESLDGIRLTVFGGEQLPESTVTAWQSAAPNSRIVNLYGPTEATVFCLEQTVGNPLPLTPGRHVLAIGHPLPGNEAMVVDADGKPVEDGTHGELLIAGGQLADGYLNAPDLTGQRFPLIEGKRWYRTGDLALRDADGRFHCLGRIDNQVKVLGYRVELEEIDAHIRVVSGTDLVGSVAWPLVDGMARGIVSFVGLSGLSAEQVIDAMKSRVPPYMVPNRVVALVEMPLNTSGKVDRRALRQMLEAALA